MSIFHLKTTFSPSGDQPKAIKKLTKNFLDGKKYQTLLGVTGSGKTFTIANVIQNLKIPTLIISPNKTLAAQLYSEFKTFFPEDAVEYFISYYDYYQPESYIPQSDTYIEKDASVNSKIDALRLHATTSLINQKNCIIIASVSCIYGLGSPEDYEEMTILIKKNQTNFNRKNFLIALINMQYTRNDKFFSEGNFRIKGDQIDIFPPYLKTAIKIEFFDNELERILLFNPLTNKIISEKPSYIIYPAKHFVMQREKIESALKSIKAELKKRLKKLTAEKKLLEADRLKKKVEYDIEILNEMGYCNGIENYSKHFYKDPKNFIRPYCLLDYFKDNFLTIIDESHIAIPQIQAMYNGDHARKQTLVDYGFRLPSALDNRPLKFNEFENFLTQTIFISATPGDYELEKSQENIVEQIIRPTGLVDPEINIRPSKNMIEIIFSEIEIVKNRQERVLITTLTKKMAEELTEYLIEKNIKAKYIHSEINALKRIEILTEFREGNFDCLIGINLLREGLDLPEVSLVIILDADKEGFLRSERSIIQTAGRAARNVNGKIIMFADTITGSMKRAISEMNRRRKLQIEYNKKHNIIPKTIIKKIDKELYNYSLENISKNNKKIQSNNINELEKEMKEAAKNWNFEKAAKLRDKIKKLKK